MEVRWGYYALQDSLKILNDVQHIQNMYVTLYANKSLE